MKKSSQSKTVNTGQNRKNALESAIGAIEKQFGKGSIMRMGEWKKSHEDVPSIPTGSLGMDIALGIGGYPRGRIVEIFGPESSGKTTITLHAIAQIQKQGGQCAFIDAEHALDIKYARRLGVNVDELLISQPDYGEQALEIMETLIRSGAVDLIVVDSVAALVPKSEIEGDMGDSHVGLQARLMSQACRKIAGISGATNTTVFFINQLRMKIGVMFGNPETTTGGNALKFYSSVRLDIRRTGAVKQGDKVIGNSTRVKVVKNKMAPPFQQAEFDIIYNQGISLTGEILDMGVDEGLVVKSGAWYSLEDGERIGQGRENARAWLNNNAEIRDSLYKKLLDIRLPKSDATESKSDEAESKSGADEGKTTVKKASKRSRKAS